VTVYATATVGETLTQPLTADSNGQLPGYVVAEQDLDVVATYLGNTAAAAEVVALRAQDLAGVDPGTGKAAVGAGLVPLLSSVESGSPKVAYVTTEGSDANNGHKWGTAYATIGHALSQVGEGGIVYVAPNTSATAYKENTLRMLQQQRLVLAGPAQCFIRLNAGQGNFVEDALWGTSTVGNSGWEIHGGCTLLSNKELAGPPVPAEAKLAENPTITNAPKTLTMDRSTAAFAAFISGGKGELWIGEHLCSFTGVSGSTLLEVATVVAGQSITPLAETLVVPFNQTGHGVAIQSRQVVIENVYPKGCPGSGFAAQGVPGYSVSASNIHLNNCQAFQCNRYSREIMPYAPDGRTVSFAGANAALGDLFMASPDWNDVHYHPSGVVSGGNWNARNARALLRLCAGSYTAPNIYIDTPPYAAVMLDTLSMGSSQTRAGITIKGEIFQASWAVAGGGAAVIGIGKSGSTLSRFENVDIDLRMRGRISRPYENGAWSAVVAKAGGTVDATTGEIQVLNARNFCPQGSTVGGTILFSVLGDVISYTGTTSATGGLAKAAAEGETEIELESEPAALGFKPGGGVVTAFPSLEQEGTVPAVALSYTGIVGKKLTGVAGIPASGLPVGTGIGQHFLTGCTGGTHKEVPDRAIVTQGNRALNNIYGDFKYWTSQPDQTTLYVPTSAAGISLRFTGINANNVRNPFRGSVTVAVGKAEGEVAHGLQQTPTWVNVTPKEATPQQLWWVTMTSSKIVVHTAVNVATTAAQFFVEAGYSAG